MKFQLRREASPAAPGTSPVETEGAAAVTEVLLPEATKSQRVGVGHEDFGGIGHAVVVVQPAVAQLAVL